MAIAAVGAGLDLIQDVQTAQAVVQLQANPENVKTNDDRVAYLESCGWLVGEEAANQEDIRLPDVFDDSYEAYLTLQESQGFDLTQYAGKTIQRYTYAVKNFPGLQENHLGQPIALPGPGHRRRGILQPRGWVHAGAGLSGEAVRGARVDLPPSDPVPPGAFPFLGFQRRNKKAPLSPVFTDQREGILLPPV